MRSFRSKPVGWRYESVRHYLAAKGIKTNYFSKFSDAEVHHYTRKHVGKLDESERKEVIMRLHKKEVDLQKRWLAAQQVGNDDLMAELYDDMIDVEDEIADLKESNYFARMRDEPEDVVAAKGYSSKVSDADQLRLHAKSAERRSMGSQLDANISLLDSEIDRLNAGLQSKFDLVERDHIKREQFYKEHAELIKKLDGLKVRRDRLQNLRQGYYSKVGDLVTDFADWRLRRAEVKERKHELEEFEDLKEKIKVEETNKRILDAAVARDSTSGVLSTQQPSYIGVYKDQASKLEQDAERDKAALKVKASKLHLSAYMASKWLLVARTGEIVGNKDGYDTPAEALRHKDASSPYVFIKEKRGKK